MLDPSVEHGSDEDCNDPKLRSKNNNNNQGERTIMNCFEHFAAKTKEQAMRIILRDCRDEDDEEIIMEAIQKHKQRSADLEEEISRAAQEKGWDKDDMLNRVNDLWKMRNMREGKLMKAWVDMGRDEIKEKRGMKEHREPKGEDKTTGIPEEGEDRDENNRDIKKEDQTDTAVPANAKEHAEGVKDEEEQDVETEAPEDTSNETAEVKDEEKNNEELEKPDQLNSAESTDQDDENDSTDDTEVSGKGHDKEVKVKQSKEKEGEHKTEEQEIEKGKQALKETTNDSQKATRTQGQKGKAAMKEKTTKSQDQGGTTAQKPRKPATGKEDKKEKPKWGDKEWEDKSWASIS